MADFVITDSSFDQEVLQSKLPVLVDFWAPWCGPCRMVSPIVEELAKEYQDKLKVGKLNVDENSQTASRYAVMSIPSLIIFRDGKPIKTMVGAQSKENFKKEIEEVLAS
ncbi:thioredoxin [Patescibacteria group bacterium]|nr:thioredoxin [Patescibacteria group bacterium]MCL5010033.1 thioredoxin [Patescibacteria group bacterium]